MKKIYLVLLILIFSVPAQGVIAEEYDIDNQNKGSYRDGINEERLGEIREERATRENEEENNCRYNDSYDCLDEDNRFGDGFSEEEEGDLGGFNRGGIERRGRFHEGGLRHGGHPHGGHRHGGHHGGRR